MGKRVNATNITNSTPGTRNSSKKVTKTTRDNIWDNLVKLNFNPKYY